MRILTDDGILNPVIECDPRIAAGGQLRTILTAARSDPHAEVIGMDQRGLPVLRARLGGSVKRSDWAVWPKGRTDVPELPLIDEWELETPDVRNDPE